MLGTLVVFIGTAIAHAQAPVRTHNVAKAPAVNSTVIGVEIEGAKTIPEAAILRHIRTQVDRPADSKQIREDARALYELRWFYYVEPKFRYTDNGLIVVFKVMERPIVRRVEYIGYRHLKLRYLHNLTGLKTGSPYDISANRECVRRIEERYKELGYPFAKVTLLKGSKPEDRDVVFKIDEGPKVKVRDISIVGNDSFRDGTIKMKLKSGSRWFWYFGGKYDPANIPADVNAITQYYHSLGYFDVKVTKEVAFSSDRSLVDLTYRIQEGPRFRVRNISFDGNQMFPTQLFLSEFETHPGAFFTAMNLSRDVEMIKLKYGERGHLFAQVDAVPKFSERSGEVDLHFRIEEDRPYIIRDVNVHIEGGNARTKESAILNRSLVQPGDLADMRKIQRTKRRLSSSQIVAGGPLNGPRIEIAKVEENWPPQLNIASTGQETRFRGQGPGLRVPSTTATTPVSHNSSFDAPITGFPAPTSTTTPGWLPMGDRQTSEPNRPTLRMMDDPSAVFRAQNFDALGNPQSQSTAPFYGSDPNGDPLDSVQPIQQPPGFIDLDYYVNENRTGRLMFGAGFNSDAGLLGSITLQETNFDILRLPNSFGDLFGGNAFRGGGQVFRLELAPGDQVSRYLVSWTDPFFLDTDYSLTVSGFYYNRFFPDWDEQRTGGRFSLGRRLTDEITVSGGLRLEEVDLRNPKSLAIPELANAVGGTLLSAAQFSIAYDTRDSSFLPTEGQFIQGSFEQAFGDLSYTKVGAEARQYFTLWERPDETGRQVLSFGGEIGHTTDDTPIYEQYFAGGYSTFRGFAFRGVGPRTGTINTGGTFSALGSIEYKIPVTANDAVAVVAFTDFGTVDNDISLDAFRATAGFGLRLTVPNMGEVPLAFDFAFPIAKEVFDDTRVFSFYVGVTR